MFIRKKSPTPYFSEKTHITPPWDIAEPFCSESYPSSLRGNTPPPAYISAKAHISDNSSDAQIAFTYWQDCSRRMNSACAASRSQSVEEQCAWWEETMSIVRNAILLHNATLNKQYDLETARNLEFLENSTFMVQTMLDSLELRHINPVRQDRARSEVYRPRTMSSTLSTAPSFAESELPQIKSSKRLGFTSMFGKVTGSWTTKESQVEFVKMVEPDAVLY